MNYLALGTRFSWHKYLSPQKGQWCSKAFLERACISLKSVLQQISTNSVAWNKTHLLSHSYCRQKSGRLHWVSGYRPNGAKIRVSAGLHSFLEVLRDNFSLIFQAVGRIRFLTVVGLNSLFLPWLSAEVHCSLHALVCAPSIVKLPMADGVLLLLPVSATFSSVASLWPQLRKIPLFYGLLWLDWAQLDNPDWSLCSVSWIITTSAMFLLPYKVTWAQVPGVMAQGGGHGRVGVWGTLSASYRAWAAYEFHLTCCFFSEMVVV